MFQLLLLTIALHWNAMKVKMFKVIRRIEIKTDRMTLEQKHFNCSNTKQNIANDEKLWRIFILVCCSYLEWYLFSIRISFGSEIRLQICSSNSLLPSNHYTKPLFPIFLLQNTPDRFLWAGETRGQLGKV